MRIFFILLFLLLLTACGKAPQTSTTAPQSLPLPITPATVAEPISQTWCGEHLIIGPITVTRVEYSGEKTILQNGMYYHFGCVYAVEGIRVYNPNQQTGWGH